MEDIHFIEASYIMLCNHGHIINILNNICGWESMCLFIIILYISTPLNQSTPHGVNIGLQFYQLKHSCCEGCDYKVIIITS